MTENLRCRMCLVNSQKKACWSEDHHIVSTEAMRLQAPMTRFCIESNSGPYITIWAFISLLFPATFRMSNYIVERFFWFWWYKLVSFNWWHTWVNDSGDDEEKWWRSLLARPPIGGTTTNAAPLPASHATTIKLVWKHKNIVQSQNYSSIPHLAPLFCQS